MKYIRNILSLLSFAVAFAASAQPQRVLPDTLLLGYGMDMSPRTDSRTATGVDQRAFENASAIDVTKALYGKIAGLNVRQGSGSSADN